MRNNHISSDRFLVEKYFGRLCTFNLFGSKWRWDERKVNTFLQFEIALANAHVILHALRASDVSLY